MQGNPSEHANAPMRPFSYPSYPAAIHHWVDVAFAAAAAVAVVVFVVHRWTCVKEDCWVEQSLSLVACIPV